MSEIIPISEIKAACPKCGAELGVDREAVNDERNAPLICPVHGSVDRLKNIRTKFVNDSRDKLIDEVRKLTRNFKLK